MAKKKKRAAKRSSKKSASKSAKKVISAGSTCSNKCNKCTQLEVLILGVLMLLNVYLGLASWGTFFGVMLILFGIINLWVPHCGH
jgi:uncharacterized membrane protein HdeD (DUF308 family)